jgi:glutathione S-transferase
MSDMILHHYPTSPFSEKVRVAFGIKGLGWKSVIIPRPAFSKLESYQAALSSL